MVDGGSNQAHNLAGNTTTPGSNPPGSDGQFNALVTDLTTTGSSSPQLTSLSDLLAVTGPTSAVANGGGGGYKFSPEELQGVLTDWKHLLDDLKKTARTAERMTQVQPPGDEDVSKNFAQRANESGEAYRRHNQEMQDYVNAYIQKLQAALDSYHNTEQAVAGSANRIEGRL
jgi:hypothetical protein